MTFFDPINAEHTVPQGWFGSAGPMRSDLHHLFPTQEDVNAARGSKPFDAARRFLVKGGRFHRAVAIA